MKDVDTLRHRVEETAERLSSAQSERQQETQSLITILRDLEEKYSAQEKQFAYYKARLEPLETSNAQLTSLIENLLDLIDRGFGESSLDPLREASEMASVLLERDMPQPDSGPAAPDVSSDEGAVNEMAETSADHVEVEPEMATLDDVDDVDESETVAEVHEDNTDTGAAVAENPSDEDVQVIQDLVELIDDSPATSDVAASAKHDVSFEAVADDEQDEEQIDGVNDLEFEEVPLSYLEDDIELASDDFATDISAVAATDLVDLGLEPESIQPAAETVSDDVMTVDSAVGDAGEWDQEARFEDVSDAVLAYELEQDVEVAPDDLPQIVKSAVAAFDSSSAADEVDALAALAQAMEKETGSTKAPAPAPSDIRSLMLRVEALAKKAEAMRIAQGEETGTSSVASDAADSAGVKNAAQKKSGVAA